MIISHEHRFIFLKTKKTAGTSLELALRAFCGDEDIIPPVVEDGRESFPGIRQPQNYARHSWWRSTRPILKRRWFRTRPRDVGFYGHMHAADARALLNDDRIWNSYFKFAFDRNPWDRQVSHYYYRCRDRRHGPPSFRDFLHRDKAARLDNFEIYSIDNDICVDFVGRFENLEEDFQKALAQIGLSLDQPLPRAKTTQRKDRRPYREIYDAETRDIVATWYEREIGLLGYSF